MARIAVVGSGISGLTAAYKLSGSHEVHLLEKNAKLGGHTDTNQVEVDGTNVLVDSGFIVHNDKTYPEFQKILAELGCKTLPTEMSFSVKSRGLEYKGKNLNTLFAQRSNLASISFFRMVRDILKFNNLAARKNKKQTGKTIGEYLEEENYSSEFKNNYLLPMAGAIWSTGKGPIKAFPLDAFLSFFQNHGLLQLRNRPNWMVVDGGSESYISAMSGKIGKVSLNCEVLGIKRKKAEVTIRTKKFVADFDRVIIATHSDQGLKLLEDPSEQEKDILSAMKYTTNKVVVHTDEKLMPERRLAWASWNYNLDASEDQVSMTYYMNLLQSLSLKKSVFVTLNEPKKIDQDKILVRKEYEHPFYNREMLESQKRHSEISGKNRTHYAGAYWGNGFHEDGVKSGLRTCEEIEAMEC